MPAVLWYWYYPPSYYVDVTTCAQTLVVSTASTAVAGAHSVTVTAKDPGANVATWYLDTIHFTSSDPAAVLPADYTFTVADAGTHVFSVTLWSGSNPEGYTNTTGFPSAQLGN